LALVRALEGRHFARTVRIVALADDARSSGAQVYARRLRTQRVAVGGVLALSHVGFRHGGPAAMIADRGGTHLVAAGREAWGAGTTLPLRTIVLPRSLAFLWAERRAFAREGWPSATITSLWPALRRRPEGRTEDFSYGVMNDLVDGLVAVIGRLAGSM